MRFLNKINIKFYKNLRLPKIKLTSFLNFFTRDELIFGLEISDCFLRLAVLEAVAPGRGGNSKNKEEKIIQARGIGEKSLKKGTVENGEVKDKKAFVKDLKFLLGKSDKLVNYAIVSISGSRLYSKAYSFPQTVAGEKLEEAMKLIVGFQLPFKQEEVYLDWEKAGNGPLRPDGSGEASQSNEVVLAASPKTVIDKYLEVLAEAGLKTVAVEFYGASVARAINLQEGQSAVVMLGREEGTETYIVKKHIAQFKRFLPEKFFPDKKSLKDEAERIVNFFENEDKNKVSFFIAANETEKDNLPKEILPSMKAEEMIGGSFIVQPEIKSSPEKWLVAVGAAIRGLSPRAEDNHISLMPMGTEEAYEKQKAISFAKFVSALTIGLSSFFVFAFVGALILMTSIEGGFNKRLNTLNSLPISGSSAILEQRAEKLNGLLVKAKNVLASAPKWSDNVTVLKSQVVAGSDIIINSFSISSAGNSVSFKGVAKNKASLNSFKKKLEDSNLFSDISFPPIGLFQVDNIPFSISFNIKKISMILENS